MNLLTRGNSKLDKSIFNWSITPIKSCLNCEDCKKSCYAIKSYRFYPTVKLAWDRNLILAKNGDFVSMVVNQLKKARTCKAVRIHVAGDFFDQNYINSWEKIILLFPNIKFYCYSKVMEILNFTAIMAAPNFNIINSIAPDGGVNFGNQDRVNELKDMGYLVCPVTNGDTDIQCGRNCSLCLTHRKVCFIEH